MISSTSATKALSCDQMVDVLMDANFENFEEAKNADKMVEAAETIRREMSQLEEDFDANAQITGKVVFYNIKSQYKLTSPLSTRTSEKHQKKTGCNIRKGGQQDKSLITQPGKKHKRRQGHAESCYRGRRFRRRS